MSNYRRILLCFSMMMLCLIAMGMLMQHKVSNMLNSVLEQMIARQTEDAADVVEEKFRNELNQLKFAAKYISAHPNPQVEIDILKKLDTPEAAIRVGMIRLDGIAIHGIPIFKRDFKLLPDACRGEEIIDYCMTTSILFAVPVMNGNNVRAVLYKLYGERILMERFVFTEYDSDIKMLIQAHNGHVTVLCTNYGAEDRELFTDSSIRAGFKHVQKKFTMSRAAATYYGGAKGELFLFGADLPKTNCSIISYIP